MNQLLKAMGFWIWGLIAIGLSVALVSMNGRVLSLYRAHDIATATRVTAPAESHLAVNGDSQIPSLQAPPRGLMISRVIAAEMTAAQKAVQAGQWTEAVKYLEAARTKSGLTPFDEMSIDRFEGYANIKLNNLRAAQDSYERALATGAVPAADKTSMTRTLFTLAATSNQYQKTIDYGEEMADAGVATPNDVAMIAQSFYQMKDCKNSSTWSDKAIAAAFAAGEAPKENVYLFKLQCASDAGYNAAMIPILIDLIRLNNKSMYWNILLRIERREERDDHNTLMLYRLMYDTGAMSAGSDYIEMAQLLGDAGLSGEAQTVLEKAMSARLINDQQRERTDRLLNSYKNRAEADKMSQAQLAAAAPASWTANITVKLGEVYYGSGDYENAAATINLGLQPNADSTDEGYVYLGRAQVQLKNIAGAKQAFAGLKSSRNVSPRVLRLYQLYSDTLHSPS